MPACRVTPTTKEATNADETTRKRTAAALIKVMPRRASKDRQRTMEATEEAEAEEVDSGSPRTISRTRISLLPLPQTQAMADGTPCCSPAQHRTGTKALPRPPPTTSTLTRPSIQDKYSPQQKKVSRAQPQNGSMVSLTRQIIFDKTKTDENFRLMS